MRMMFRDAFLSLFQIRSVPAADLQWSQRFRAQISSPPMKHFFRKCRH